MNGTAANFFNGNTQIGSATPTAGTEKLQVTGTASISSTLLLGGALNGKSATLTPTSNASSSVVALNSQPSTSSHYVSNRVGNAYLFGTGTTGELYLGANTDGFTATITGASSYMGQNNGAFTWLSAPSVSAGAAPTFTQYMGLSAAGVLTLNAAPTTSAGTYDILTRNTSTGVVEKVASSGLPTSGTYSPTLTNGANVTASSSLSCHYIRVGNIVTVTGSVQVQPTVGVSTATIIDLSLPVASNFTASGHLSGQSNGNGTTYALSGVITADITNDTAQLEFPAIGTGSQFQIWFNFTYTVI